MNRRILHLEDDENDVFFLKTNLQRLGFTGVYRHVRNGNEAIEYLLGEGAYWDRDLHPAPDLIVCDLKMPGMDGFEFLRWLRSNARLAKLPVFTLSSSDLEKDKRAALKAGANDYLVKPDSWRKWESLAQRILGIQNLPFPDLSPGPRATISPTALLLNTTRVRNDPTHNPQP